MKVLGFGTYDVRTHPRVGVLLDGLRRRGYSVAELNRPLGIGTAGRVAALSHPTQLLHFAVTLLTRWCELAVGSLRFRGAAHPDVVLVGYLGHFDVVLARALFPRARIVLDHLIFAADTAKDRGIGQSLRMSLLQSLDRIALEVADDIVVDTPAHREMVPLNLRPKVLTVLVGAPEAWFDARPSKPRHLKASHGALLSVIFFGLYTPLQGSPTIARGLRDAAKICPLEITMVGTGQDYDECRKILTDTNVVWIEWTESEELPRLVAAHDICMGILGTTPKARNVVPNKVYQGMAAGCCVITSDTTSQRKVLGEDVIWCTPGSSEQLTEIIVGLSSNPQKLDLMRERAAMHADLHFMPDTTVLPLVEALERVN